MASDEDERSSKVKLHCPLRTIYHLFLYFTIYNFCWQKNISKSLKLSLYSLITIESVKPKLTAEIYVSLSSAFLFLAHSFYASMLARAVIWGVFRLSIHLSLWVSWSKVKGQSHWDLTSVLFSSTQYLQNTWICHKCPLDSWMNWLEQTWTG